MLRLQGWPYRFWHGGDLSPPIGGDGWGGGLARNSRQNFEVSKICQKFVKQGVKIDLVSPKMPVLSLYSEKLAKYVVFVTSFTYK